MYTLTEREIKGLNYLELISSDGRSKVQLCLDQGGRLSNLIFENIQILATYEANTYHNNYASSILFPFANRIKNGEYNFAALKYKLSCNETERNNALHGLVYNKRFNFTDKELTSNYASVTLQYEANHHSKGFPYKFIITLKYTLDRAGLKLSVTVLNKDKTSFPFTIGWHPYFKSNDLYNSSINFKSDTKYLFDNQQIISGSTSLDIEMPFKLNDSKLDDCYPLKSNEVEFLTPHYKLKITSTSKENFLQLYTPDQPNIIAIEPMTGAADNFNNHIGLQTLQPNDTYTVDWNLTIKTL